MRLLRPFSRVDTRHYLPKCSASPYHGSAAHLPLDPGLNRRVNRTESPSMPVVDVVKSVKFHDRVPPNSTAALTTTPYPREKNPGPRSSRSLYLTYLSRQCLVVRPITKVSIRALFTLRVPGQWVRIPGYPCLMSVCVVFGYPSRSNAAPLSHLSGPHLLASALSVVQPQRSPFPGRFLSTQGVWADLFLIYDLSVWQKKKHMSSQMLVFGYRWPVTVGN